MSPLKEFFRSINDGFTPEAGDKAMLWVGIGVLIIGGLGVVLFLKWRRWRTEREAFAHLIASLRMTTEDVALARQLAKRVAKSPRFLATQMDAFERATRLELRELPQAMMAAEDDLFGRVRHLRCALGFHDLPPHFPLLTTRELPVGTQVRIADVSAPINVLTEAFFNVEMPDVIDLKVGLAVPLAVLHGHEARYLLRCVLLAKEHTDIGWRLVFAHDEGPKRVQLRETVRVPAHGEVRIELMAGQAPDAPRTFAGTMVDVSMGGLSFDAPNGLPEGTTARIEFEFQGVSFHDIKTQVVGCLIKDGTPHLRLKFVDVPASDERQLARLIFRQSARHIDAEG